MEYFDLYKKGLRAPFRATAWLAGALTTVFGIYAIVMIFF